MAEKVRVGLIGAGGWADLALLPMFSHLERAQVVAVCGRRREPAEALAAKYGIAQVFTDYRAMFAQAALDAVVVATPDDTHTEIVMAALDAGLHVMVEKPVAMNARDVQAMRDKAEAARLRHVVMFTWHWLPQLQRLKALVDAGRLGRIYHADFQWQSAFFRSGAYRWRLDAAHANGVLGDLGAHLFHLALWTMGDVAAVSAQLGFHIPLARPDGQPFTAANDSARVLLEFASGAQASVEVSAVAHLTGPMNPHVALYGEKGTVEGGWTVVPDFSRRTSYLRGSFDGDADGIREEQVFEGGAFYETHPAGRQFIDAILDGAPLSPGLDMGYKVQQIIDAALRSHRTGCKVAIAP